MSATDQCIGSFDPGCYSTISHYSIPQLVVSLTGNRMVEVDLVIEQGRNVWGVEVKRAETIRAKDANGLARLKAQSGHHFRGGMVL